MPNQSKSTGPDSPDLEQLCLACAICCNGVLFRDVELQPGDSPERLKALGMPLSRRRGKSAFDQPCAALEGCRCRLYAHRPEHCRQFECALYKSVRGGRTSMTDARRVIRSTRQRADRVRGLLRQLGDPQEHRALSRRFRSTSRRLEQAGFNDETAELFGELTLAVHDLNLVLRQAFYPGEESSAKTSHST